MNKFAQQTPGQARVVDPILTNIAHEYTNSDFVLDAIFPVIPISQRGGRVIRFGKESFRRYSTLRAPGANTKRVQFGYASDAIALEQHSLEGLVPVELQQEALTTTHINLSTHAVEQTLAIMALSTEYQRAKIATDAANFGDNVIALSGSDQWSDPAADIKQQIDDAKEDVRRRTGRYPNVLVVSPRAYRHLQNNVQIVDRNKYTSSKSITMEMLAAFFDLEKVIVPKAVSLPDGASDDAAFEDVWGNFATLAYAPSRSGGIDVPAFGYTYRLNGHPMVEQAYYDNNTKSWVYPVMLEERPYHTAADAGYLFTNVSANEDSV